jgi:hypothetical protein
MSIKSIATIMSATVKIIDNIKEAWRLYNIEQTARKKSKKANSKLGSLRERNKKANEDK